MIYVECKPDKVLVQNLMQVPQRNIVHELKGKYEVMKRLNQQANSIALLDEDPTANQPAYLRAMQVLEDIPGRGLRILEDATKDNRVVLLCPRLEEWILGAARDEAVNLEAYALPDDPVSLHRVINVDLRKFERLVENLKDSERLRALSRLLTP